MITSRLPHWRFLRHSGEQQDESDHPFNLNFLRNFFGLPAPARTVLTSNTFHYLGIGIGSAFINYFLLRQLTSLHEVAFFTLLQFPGLITSYLIVTMSKRRLFPKNITRLATVFALSFFLALILFKDHISSFIWAFGFIFGLSEGLYWSSQNVLEYLTTNDGNRDNFYSYYFAAISITSVIVPLVSAIVLGGNLLPGATIITNYYILFSIAIVILAGTYLYAGRLPTLTIPRVSLSELISLTKHERWPQIMIVNLLDGLKWGFDSLVASFLIFQIINQESTIGTINALFATLTAVTAILLSREINPKNRNRLLLISGASLLLANILFVQAFSFIGLLCYLLINIIFSPMFNTTSTSAVLEIVGQESAKTMFNPWILSREICLAIGRISGVSLFILLLIQFNELDVSKYWFMASGALTLTSALLIAKLATNRSTTTA